MDRTLAAAAVLAISVLSVAPVSAQTPAQPSTRARVWELGGKLSLAGLGIANNAPPDSVARVFESARQIGTSLGVDVPPLPERELDRAATQSKVEGYLLADAGARIANRLGGAYGADHAALFEVAVKSNLLLLLYTPGSPEGVDVATVLKKRGPDAGIPEALWQPLVAKIEARAPFDDVKEAVTALQSGMRKHLKTGAP